MDPLSQAALGAVAARSVVADDFAEKARGSLLLVGAVAGALPDIDVLFSIGGDFYDQLITHRGITHSLFFAPAAGPVLGWLVWLWRRRQEALFGWMLVCVFALWSHPLLDVLTAYGTQLLQPFSDRRFAVFAMPIIDPLYTLLLCLGVLAAWRTRASRLWGLIALLLSCGYLFYGWLLNERAKAYAEDDLAAQGVVVNQVEAFPTILQPYMRRVVARSSAHDYVGFVSMWEPCPVDWRRGARYRGPLVDVFEARRDGGVFAWFTMGWVHYAIRVSEGSEYLIAADLRYGTDEDPAVSVFSTAALLEEGGLSPQPARALRRTPGSERLDELINLTYGVCVTPGAGAPAATP